MMTVGTHQIYDSYTDSGVPWIGSIPAHWRVENPKWLFSNRKTRAERGERQLAATQKYGVIPQDEFMELEGRRVTQVFLDFDILKHVESGDFVMSMRSFQGGIEYSEFSGCVSSAYVALKPGPQVHCPFFKYLLKSSRYIEALQATSNLVRDGQALRFENFSMIPLPIVPADEQRAIAAFLDEKCARIDEAVRIKEEQIALLRERRQILIQKVVTHGLNPDAPMKDSGVDWIGRIPAHWEVKRNKHMFVEVNERSANGDEQHLSMSQKLGLVPADMVEKSLVSESYQGAKLVRQGDLVLNRLKAHLAVFSIAPMEGLVSPDYSVFRPFVAGVSSQYFEALFRTSIYLGEFRQRVRGIVEGFFRLYTDSFMDVPLIIPPQHEQTIIIDHLEQMSSEFGDAINIKEEQIEALKEYKTVLINAAVTGKINVA